MEKAKDRASAFSPYSESPTDSNPAPREDVTVGEFRRECPSDEEPLRFGPEFAKLPQSPNRLDHVLCNNVVGQEERNLVLVCRETPEYNTLQLHCATLI